MKRILAFGIVALAITACGDDRAAAPATAGEAVVTSPAAAPAPSTTVAAPAPTTSEPMPTTTMPETTTTVATEDLIKQAVQDFIANYFRCGQAPEICDPTTFTAASGAARATVTDLAKGMVEQGLRFSTDLRGSYLVPQSVDQTSESTASAVFCAYDALIVLGPLGPDGVPTVVNDEISSQDYEYRMFREDDGWRVGQQVQLEVLGEENRCPAA